MTSSANLLENDILGYLKQHENKDLLRFLTCGSVDDGKSTLIGRLLYDSKLIFEDHLSALKKDNERVGNAGEALDLALLVDGLASEREQGITIDVAYRYFSTDKRKFIIADTPGHEQYTRNMATGASTCELAIVMIDARKGVLTQTKRHSYIVSLLGIKHVIVAINKMDLVNFDEQVYENIKADYAELANKLGLEHVMYAPISALNGDNVVNRSEQTPWYNDQTLMEMLETVEVAHDANFTDMRFPVQYVNRPNLDFRGFCGTLTSGVVKKGDSVTALPSGKSSKIKSIVTYEGELAEAFPGQAITLTLEDEIDISRGDMIVHTDNQPLVGRELVASVVWMDEQPLQTNKEYGFKFASKELFGLVNRIDTKTDVNTFEKSITSELKLNEIGQCQISLSEKIPFDQYKNLPKTGSFIIVDRLTNVTVGAGMIKNTNNNVILQRTYTESEKALNKYIRKFFPEWGCKKI